MPNVLISGASIAGPTLAYWLDRAGFATTVVERAPEPRKGGQAIDVRGPALQVINAMGLLERVQSLRTRFKGMSKVDIDGKEIARMEDRTATGGRFDSGDVEILRDDLAELLRDGVTTRSEYLYGNSIAGLRDDGSQIGVDFERGPSRLFDLVVGADGLGSNVRRLAFGDDAKFLRPLGVVLAIYTMPNILGLRDWEIAYRDAESGYVVYPARDNTELRVNFGFGAEPHEHAPGDIAAHKALIRRGCAHLRGDVPRLLDAMDGVDDLYFGEIAQVRMPSWSTGRVGLIGDSGYCPSPFAGQGTSLALVGAFVLAKELARSPGDHAGAFARYEARMRPFVLMNQDMVSVERTEPIPDDIFDRAKNGISLADLMEA